MRNTKTWVLNAFLVLVTLVVMLVLNEAVLRVYFWGSLLPKTNEENPLIPHPTRGFAFRPATTSWHQELDFTVRVEINKQGLRGPEIGPKDDKKRILIIGDSTTYGSGVPQEEIIPSLLAEELGPNQVEVVNGSFTTYNTVQELLFLEEEGLSFEPDLVVLAFSPNTDIQANTLSLQQLAQKHNRRPYASLTPGGELQLDLTYAEQFYQDQQEQADTRKGSFLKKFVTYKLIKKYVKGFKSSKWNDPNMFIGWPFLAEFAPEHSTRGMSAEEYQSLWDDGWDVTKALIVRMRDDSRKKSSEFAMMVMAPKLQVETDYQQKVQEVFPHLKLDVTRINRAFEEFGKEAGIPVLDALTPLREAWVKGAKGLYYNVEDEHMTAKSHELVAASLAKQIRAQRLLDLK
ncbi:MAG: hypothetical protein R3B74_08940 [Nitrospirales bacterium]|nr:hypothetical protein [Nitrospirales bacterium]